MISYEAGTGRVGFSPRGAATPAMSVPVTFDLPEPFDRAVPPTLITTTTGMAALKAGHPANQTIECGFRSLNIPVPDVIQALSAREAALVGDGSTIHSFHIGGAEEVERTE